MTALELMAKAEQALRSARVLLDSGDADGACNRAYYAMFDADRAVLHARGVSGGKTHRGVLNAFHANFVKGGLMSVEMGRHLKHAEALRYFADCESEPLVAADAADVVDQAQAFVNALRCVVDASHGKTPDLP